MSKKPCTDHTGHVFNSRADMCNAWGITISQYETRSSKGWSLKEVLTTPRGFNPKKKMVKDHLGKKFISVEKMCEYWGIADSTYQQRRAKGLSIKDALTFTTEEVRDNFVTDHLGNKFPSKDAMCKYWKIDRQIFFGRQKLGWSLEDCLTKPKNSIAKNSVQVTDHEGNTFNSISELCRHWNIGLSTYRERIKRGWEMKDALTLEQKSEKVVQKPCKDHLGKEYPSLAAMCKAYNIRRTMFSSRLKLGWSLEDALETPEIISCNSVTDYKGREFPSQGDFCNFYGAPPYMIQGRIVDADEKQTEKAKMKVYNYCFKKGNKIAGYTVIKQLTFPYFLVEKDGAQIIKDLESVLDEFHNSEEFLPVPRNKTIYDIKDIKLVEFPYYELEFRGEKQIWTYWQIIQYRKDCNFADENHKKGL